MSNVDQKPKKPLNAFFRFKSENYDKVKKENPTLAMTELTSLLGDMYKNISQKDKDRYAAAIKKEEEKYLKDFEVYKQANPDYQERKKSQKRTESQNKGKDAKGKDAKNQKVKSSDKKSSQSKGDHSQSKGKANTAQSKNEKKGKSVDKKDDRKNGKKADSKNIAKDKKDGVAKKKKNE